MSSSGKKENKAASELTESRDDIHESSSTSAASETALVLYRPMVCLTLTTTYRTTKNEDDPYIPYMILDVVPIILSYCDAQTVSRASCVCREWHAIGLSNDLWENLCRSCFGVSAQEIKPSPDPTKLLYVWTHRRLRQVCRHAAATSHHPLLGVRQRGSLPCIPVTAFCPSWAG